MPSDRGVRVSTFGFAVLFGLVVNARSHRAGSFRGVSPFRPDVEARIGRIRFVLRGRRGNLPHHRASPETADRIKSRTQSASCTVEQHYALVGVSRASERCKNGVNALDR